MGELDSSDMGKKQADAAITPLPKRQLFVICGLVSCAMFSFAVIYPFLPFLVGWCE
eukprot:COSAG04_NODE_1695_length_5903_cov_8.707099_2_plen_56_part_00